MKVERAYAISRWVAMALLKPLFLVTARGRDHVPATGPVVLAANHGSFLDPPLVGSWSPRQVRFLARSTLEKIPIVGAWMRWVGTRFVDRDAPSARALQAMIEVLQAGDVVVVFPEGTRTRDGRLGPFKRGLLLLLKKSDATVVPTGIRGSFHAFPRGRKLPRPFRRCTVVFGEPMTAAEVLSPGGLELLRRRVAEVSGQELVTTTGEDSVHSQAPAREETPGR